MKPISIRFKCFGPYIEEQFIDFRDLEKSGLFLICGETGSGKTTILDAICYALYGQSSGGSRGEMSDMRCNGAPEYEATLVEYIFSSGENTYRFFRSVKPRKQRKESIESGKAQSFNEEYECQILRDDQYVPMFDTKATKTYMNKKAQDIIGLNYDQFKQVVILPQGKFEQLLTSDSGAKEEILVTLFHAEKWKKIAENIYTQVTGDRKDLDKKKAAFDGELKGFGCERLEELSVLSEETGREVESLDNRRQEIEAVIAQRKKAYDLAKDADKAFADLEKAEKDYHGLLMQGETQKRNQVKLDRAVQADKIEPAYRDYQAKCTVAEKAAKVRAEREKDLAAAEQKVERVWADTVEHEKQRESYEEKKAQVIRLDSLAEIYQSLDHKKDEWTEAETERQRAEKQQKAAEVKLGNADQKLQQALAGQKAAAGNYERAQETYMRNIGSELAMKLVEGEKCPVCGSCHHPELAQPTQDHVTKEQLDRLAKTSKDAMDAVSLAMNEREKAAEQFNREKETASEFRQKAELAQKLYEDALTRRVDGIDNESQRVALISNLGTQITDFETKDKTLQERRTGADSAHQTAVELERAAKESAQEAEQALTEARVDWAARLDEAGFGAEQEFLDSYLEPAAKQQLQLLIVQYQKDLEVAEKKTKELRGAVGELVRPDLKQLAVALSEAEQKKDEIVECYGAKRGLHDKQVQVLTRLNVELPKLERDQLRNRENLEFAQRLRGDSGISLQRYVLGVMLTSITREANRLLKTAYGGRYRLYRSNEAQGRAHKRGLELEVEDQDGRRSANSLSGGEKFLLSLSLGIGLAAVVQAQGNGIRLEAMFIDEGFGSLDEKCIDDAMDILESVRRSAGIVGIISHVERLSDTIPTKIEIQKTKHGSQCKVCC